MRRIAATPGLIVVLVVVAIAPSAAPSRPPLEVTYVANEGFLLVIPPPEIPGNPPFNENKVLVDGLFRDGIPPYAAVPPNRREEVETARPPFDAAKVLLVSHYHADHFDAAAVARYLKHNFRAVLVSSPQVVDAVAEALNDDVILRNRVRRVEPQGSQPVTLAVEGIGLRIYRVSHGTGRHAEIQNLGHLVTLGGWKILHIGDADAGEDELKSFDWEKEEIDVALLPFWYLTDEKRARLVKRYIRARHIVAMHIPPEELGKRTAQIHARFLQAVIFTEFLQTHTFN